MTRAALVLLICVSTGLAAPTVEQQAPVRNFNLPFFNTQGDRTALLRGDEVRALSPEEFQLAGLHYSQFEPPNPRPETVLLAPEARVVLINRQPVISGPKVVRLLRSDLEASGEEWRYDHAGKTLSLGRAVRVVYDAELKDLLR
jgi:hypothetical protein